MPGWKRGEGTSLPLTLGCSRGRDKHFTVPALVAYMYSMKFNLECNIMHSMITNFKIHIDFLRLPSLLIDTRTKQQPNEAGSLCTAKSIGGVLDEKIWDTRWPTPTTFTRRGFES